MTSPAELLALSTDELLDRASQVRTAAFGNRVTYSPKVFIPLTMLCNDKCGYCTFAQPPARLEAPYLTPDQVLEIARAGAAAGCHEALFTLGERPEDRYPLAAEWLAANGSERVLVVHGHDGLNLTGRRGQEHLIGAVQSLKWALALLGASERER